MKFSSWFGPQLKMARWRKPVCIYLYSACISLLIALAIKPKPVSAPAAAKPKPEKKPAKGAFTDEFFVDRKGNNQGWNVCIIAYAHIG